MNNIAHLICSKNFSGIEQHVHELTFKLANNSDHEIFIFADKTLEPHFQNHKFQVFPNKFRFNLYALFKLRKLIKDHKIQILHCHGSKSILLGRWVSWVTKVELIATVHANKKRPVATNGFRKTIIVNKLLKKTYPEAEVIANWVNPKLEILNSSRDGNFIAVGRLEKIKRFDLLIHAWKGINEKLEIIGDGQEKNNLLTIIKNNNLAKQITIRSEVNSQELGNIYKKAKGLIITSSREGGPRVALEAAAFNLPVFGTNVGIMGELFPQEVLADPNNEDEIISLIRSFVPLAKNLNVSAIKERIFESYTVESSAKKVSKIYNSVLSNSL
jgi:glycosyltransferase involved in cell wall biosynthesis